MKRAAKRAVCAWLIWFLALVFVISLWVGIRQACARDVDGRYAGSPLHDWFEGLHSGRGPCCSDADGTAVADADWEAVNDRSKPNVHYRVFIDDGWRDVYDNAVITEPNRAGRTMVWPVRYRREHGVDIDIRCFMPGPMT
jgi:hypothetical protein